MMLVVKGWDGWKFLWNWGVDGLMRRVQVGVRRGCRVGDEMTNGTAGGELWKVGRV